LNELRFSHISQPDREDIVETANRLDNFHLMHVETILHAFLFWRQGGTLNKKDILDYYEKNCNGKITDFIRYVYFTADIF
jgi:hypothetical protein